MQDKNTMSLRAILNSDPDRGLGRQTVTVSASQKSAQMGQPSGARRVTVLRKPQQQGAWNAPEGIRAELPLAYPSTMSPFTPVNPVKTAEEYAAAMAEFTKEITGEIARAVRASSERGRNSAKPMSVAAAGKPTGVTKRPPSNQLPRGRVTTFQQRVQRLEGEDRVPDHSVADLIKRLPNGGQVLHALHLLHNSGTRVPPPSDLTNSLLPNDRPISPAAHPQTQASHRNGQPSQSTRHDAEILNAAEILVDLSGNNHPASASLPQYRNLPVRDRNAERGRG